MVSVIGNKTAPASLAAQKAAQPQNTSPRTTKAPGERRDILQLGGKGISSGQAQNIVTERAYERLRQIVSDARAQLGLPEDQPLDTSPEATANRIADFALGFFSKYAKNNGLEDNEEGRKQYATFIGTAIQQGIEEARGILTALSALNPQISQNIDKTSSLIQQRLDDFVKNGLRPQA